MMCVKKVTRMTVLLLCQIGQIIGMPSTVPVPTILQQVEKLGVEVSW